MSSTQVEYKEDGTIIKTIIESDAQMDLSDAIADVMHCVDGDPVAFSGVLGTCLERAQRDYAAEIAHEDGVYVEVNHD